MLALPRGAAGLNEGWVWWEGGSLLTKLLFPPVTSTAQTPQIWGLQGEEAASFPAPPHLLLLISEGSRDRFRGGAEDGCTPLSPFGAVCSVTCFPCGEIRESVMCLDCFALLLLFFGGLCHLWSHLKQDGLSCKT